MPPKPPHEELMKRVDSLEKQIVESSQRTHELKTIFHLSLDMIGTGNLDGYFTRINSSFERILGYTEDEFIQKPFLSFVHEDDVEVTKQALAAAANGKTDLHVENRYRCKDGCYIWIEWKVFSLFEEKKFIAVGRDITQHKTTLKMLQENEQRFKLAGKAAYDLIYEWDVATDSLQWFGDIDGMLGFKPGEISRDITAWLALIHSDDRPLLENAVEIHRTSTKKIEYDYRIQHKNGMYRYWHDHALPLLDSKGVPYRWVGVCTDITRQKQAEKALQESEEKYRMLVENTPDLLYRTGLDGRIVFISPSVYQLSGYTVEEAIGMNMAEEVYVNPEERNTFIAQLQENGSIKNFEAQLRRKDGSVWWASTNAHFYRDQDGQIIGVEGVTRDVTDIKKTEKERNELETQLHRQEKMKSLGLMAGGIAHDLNNILSGIVGYPDLILMKLEEDSPLIEPIETMKKSGQRAADVVADLMTIARGVTTKVETLNLNKIVDEFMGSAECLNLKKMYPDIIFESELDNALFNINGSSLHINKALMNLVINAAQAITGKGHVRISTRNCYLDRPLKGYDDIQPGEYSLLSVSDNGLGITQEDLEHIFEPFYTKKNMRKGGTGLGLTVVWNTVHDHDGYINVDNRKDGTTFELYFQITHAELAVSEQETSIGDILGSGETILVVDDDAQQREIALVMLKQLGYEPETVPSGEAAIDYLKTQSMDLIVLDMIMDPGMDGLETYQGILKLQPGQKAIITSGFSETVKVREAQRLGAGLYVKKPYTLQSIGHALKAEFQKERQPVAE